MYNLIIASWQIIKVLTSINSLYEIVRATSQRDNIIIYRMNIIVEQLYVDKYAD